MGVLTGKGRAAATFFAILLLAGCATPQTPAQTVYAISGGYYAALAGAVAYMRLPDCVRAPAPCSSAAVVHQLAEADTVAWNALSVAQIAARNPGAPEAVAAIADATTAVNAFTHLLEGAQ